MMTATFHSDLVRNLIVSGEPFVAPRPQTRLEYLQEWAARLGITFKPSRSDSAMRANLEALMLKIDYMTAGM